MHMYIIWKLGPFLLGVQDEGVGVEDKGLGGVGFRVYRVSIVEHQLQHLFGISIETGFL